MSDVFISHSSKDSGIADKVVAYFEERGLSCWMAPRDIVPGTEWAAAITTAITASKVFLIIYTENSAESSQVVREINLAETKPGVFVVPYKTDETPLKGSFEYYLTGAHFIAADYAKQDYKLEELYSFVSGIVGKHIQNITNNTHIDTLNIASVEAIPESISEAVKKQTTENVSGGSGSVNSASGRPKTPLVIGASAAVLVVIAAVVIFLSKPWKGGTTAVDVSPTPTAGEVTVPLDEGKPVVQLMEYINKYGNHFENEKGEYYSIKKSVSSSIAYFTSRYKTASETGFPLELGISDGEMHIQVWLRYNAASDGFELEVCEDGEQKNPGSVKIRLDHGFPGDFSEEDIYDYKEPAGFGREEFLGNAGKLSEKLYSAAEEFLADADIGVSMKTLGLEKRQ